MSKERELLLKWVRRYIALNDERKLLKQIQQFLLCECEDTYGFAKDIEDLLGQPEQEPLSEEEIKKAFAKSYFGIWDIKSYRAGFKDAEKAHSITGGGK